MFKENYKEYIYSHNDITVDELLNNIPSAWNIPVGQGHRQFVEWLIKEIKPKVTVELGVDLGYSAFVMALCQENEVYGIDNYQIESHSLRQNDDYSFVMWCKDKLKLTNLTIIKDDFNNVAKTWNKQIDLLHIDGLHDYENCKNDYDTWSKFVSDDGVILFHDVISNPNTVGVFFNELNLPKVYFENSCGLGVVSKNNNLILKIAEVFN